MLDELEDANTGLCDACLLGRLKAASHQHVNATCRNLEKEGKLIREKQEGKECDECGNARVISRLIPGAFGTFVPYNPDRTLKRMKRLLSHSPAPVLARPKQINNPAPSSTPVVTAPAEFGINELDALRREMIQFLNRLDRASTREGFSKRVTLLRNSQALPSRIASLMLTHAAYRNDCYYNGYVLSEDETKILDAIDKCLRAYIANAKPQTQMAN
ncbi:MAG: hypothetical protein WA414_20480 [Acidobacteriaceae bacterium]